MSPAPGSSPDTKDPQILIRLLQAELATTNQEVMILTLDLEKRVAERVTQLSAANKELQVVAKPRG